MNELAIRPNPRVEVPILHEDPDLLIINKPAGSVVQPGKGHAGDSLLNGLFAMKGSEGAELGKLLHNLGERRDYGLLHRLDKETSGLLVVAKSPNAYDQLRRDFEARNVDKEYLALVAGTPKPLQGVVQARLKEMQIVVDKANKWEGSVKKVVISREGQEAISVYRVSSHAPIKGAAIEASLVHVTIKTGRLHQIRAHMLFLNCQVFGDPLYTVVPPLKFPREFPHPPRLCLHAARLGFKHPATGKWVHYESPLPADLAKYAAKLGLTLPPESIPG